MAKIGRKTPQRDKARILFTVGALALVGLVVAGLLWARPPSQEPLSVGDDPWLGDEGAPVTLFYFADFQCPFCARFELKGTMDRLKEEFIAPGHVRLVFKDFPLVGEDSWTAAEASQFVWEHHPGVYWEWHRGLFERQGPENSGWAGAENIVAYSRGFAAIDADALAVALADRLT